MSTVNSHPTWFLPHTGQRSYKVLPKFKEWEHRPNAMHYGTSMGSSPVITGVLLLNHCTSTHCLLTSYPPSVSSWSLEIKRVLREKIPSTFAFPPGKTSMVSRTSSPSVPLGHPNPHSLSQPVNWCPDRRRLPWPRSRGYIITFLSGMHTSVNGGRYFK